MDLKSALYSIFGKGKPPRRMGTGFTPYPDHLMDAHSALTGSQQKVLDFVVRKNLGWAKPNKRFSVRHIARGAGIGKTAAADARKWLVEHGYLHKTGVGPQGEWILEVSDFSIKPQATVRKNNCPVRTLSGGADTRRPVGRTSLNTPSSTYTIVPAQNFEMPPRKKVSGVFGVDW